MCRAAPSAWPQRSACGTKFLHDSVATHRPALVHLVTRFQLLIVHVRNS
jgi:hypothetical protein